MITKIKNIPPTALYWCVQIVATVLMIAVFVGNWAYSVQQRDDAMGQTAAIFANTPVLATKAVSYLDQIEFVCVSTSTQKYSLAGYDQPIDSSALTHQKYQYLVDGQLVVVEMQYQPYFPPWWRFLVAFIVWLLVSLGIIAIARTGARSHTQWQADQDQLAHRLMQALNSVPNFSAITVREGSHVGLIANRVNQLFDAVSRHFRQTSVSQQEPEFTGDARTEELFYRANFDPLTGLANRYYLIDRLQHSLASASRNNRMLSVLFVDLDQFKQVNDRYGHSIGDRLLIQVGERLQALVRRTDLVSRLGGDEFLVLLEDARQREDAERVAGVLATRVSEPYFIDGHQIQISSSIGVSMFPDDGTTAMALMANADTGMYAAKKSGQASVVSFEEDMLESSQRRLTLQYHLERAIDNQELRLQYQPQIDCETGQVTAAEALIRWSNPVLGVLFPLDFLSELDDLPLFDDVQVWVVRLACADYLDWKQQDVAPNRLVINVSTSHFSRSKFEERLVQTISQSGVAPECVEIEFAEDSLVQEPERIAAAIRYLDDHGVGTSVDRFGAGYSSLVNLRNLPLKSIKVDRAFVSDVVANTASQAIIEATAALGRALNVSVGAMGVESAEQAAMLKTLGCSLMQGYHICEPLEAYDFIETMRKGFSVEKISGQGKHEPEIADTLSS